MHSMGAGGTHALNAASTRVPCSKRSRSLQQALAFPPASARVPSSKHSRSLSGIPFAAYCRHARWTPPKTKLLVHPEAAPLHSHTPFRRHPVTHHKLGGLAFHGRQGTQQQLRGGQRKGEQGVRHKEVGQSDEACQTAALGPHGSSLRKGNLCKRRWGGGEGRDDSAHTARTVRAENVCSTVMDSQRHMRERVSNTHLQAPRSTGSGRLRGQRLQASRQPTRHRRPGRHIGEPMVLQMDSQRCVCRVQHQAAHLRVKLQHVVA
jgi:hypothetical protein